MGVEEEVEGECWYCDGSCELELLVVLFSWEFGFELSLEFFEIVGCVEFYGDFVEVF